MRSVMTEPESELHPEPDAAPPAAPPSQKRTWVIAAVCSVVAALATVVGVKVLGGDSGDATTLSASPSVARFGNAGKITKISGDSFTLQSQTFNGQTETVEVSTNGDTTFHDVVAGSLLSLKVGQSIVAMGTTTDGVFTATRISPAEGMGQRRVNGTPPPNAAGQMPPGNVTGEGPRVFQSGDAGTFAAGEITKIEGNTITVKNLDGTTSTISVTDTTAVMVSKTIALKDLKVGDDVRVDGETKSNVLQAENVTRGDQPMGGLRSAPITQQNQP